MDFIDLTGIPYPALPEFLIVEAILAKYFVLGVIPMAIPAQHSQISKTRSIISSSRWERTTPS